METTIQHNRGGLFQLSPFLLFVGLFVMSTVMPGMAISPLFAAIVAIMYSLLTFPEAMSFNKRMSLIIEGSTNATMLSMVYIFILSAVFTYVLKSIGAIAAAVNIALHLLPTCILLPGFFVVVALFATAVGTSMGTIAAFLPIGVGLAKTLGINPAFIAGVVINGAMLGDNLSIISDTTIAAVQATGSSMHEKFRENMRLVLPACVLTIIVLLVANWYFIAHAASLPALSITMADAIKTIPYALVFVLALLGVDVLAVLVIGILVAIGIGNYYGYFTLLQGTHMFLDGFAADKDIQMTLILSLLIAGLARIVEHNGGIAYLLRRASKRVNSLRSAELSIGGLVLLIDAAVANNTIAILIAGPLAKSIGQRFAVSPARSAALLDVLACVAQGILPYTPQLLLASALAQVSPVSIMPFLFYQFFVFLTTVISILCSGSHPSTGSGRAD